ncbi:MAG: hypothetical protein Q9219_006434 [cf. Caloplaca sp. 3 TL-2023]
MGSVYFSSAPKSMLNVHMDLKIGFQHGQEAKSAILRGLKFYEQLFLESTRMSWSKACEVAENFIPFLQKEFPDYLTEVRGLAAGAGVPVLSILALNVRTEIAFGMFSDGCTALLWKNGDTSLLAQNWDWREEQKENLIRLRIERDDKPTIDMITEAGIIGKIGLNSEGVGVCLNAVRAKGVDFNRLPCHLALRRCLDSRTREEAVTILKYVGVASSCHILIADSLGGSGIECSSSDIAVLPICPQGLITHTNHYIEEHPGIEEDPDLKDTYTRLERIRRLIKLAKPNMRSIHDLLKDEDGFPHAINRQRTDNSTIATLFSIVMDLKQKFADVRIGRPSAADESLILQPAMSVFT